MNVLFIILNDLTFLDSILTKLVELKVRGATILDSVGMGRAMMSQEGLSFLINGPFQHTFADYDGSKTIMTVIPEQDKLDQVVTEIRVILKQSKKNIIGFMFSMPVSGIYPIKSNK